MLGGSLVCWAGHVPTSGMVLPPVCLHSSATQEGDSLPMRDLSTESPSKHSLPTPPALVAHGHHQLVQCAAHGLLLTGVLA